MFAARYWAERYWAPRYWPSVGSTGAAAVPGTGLEEQPQRLPTAHPDEQDLLEILAMIAGFWR